MPAIPKTTFEDDYRVASQARFPKTLSTGFVERVYLTPTRERTDYLNLRRATIIDCGAKTVTTLDLTAKTFIVHNFEEPFPQGPISTGSPILSFRDMKVKTTTVAVALGPRLFRKTPVDAYQIHISYAMTKDDAALSSETDLIAYYSKTPVPKLECPKARVLAKAEGAWSGSLQSFDATLGNAFQTIDPSGVSIEHKGATIPIDRLPILELSSIRTLTAKRMPRISLSVLRERGHVRPIRGDDPAFSIPPDFKKVDQSSVSMGHALARRN